MEDVGEFGASHRLDLFSDDGGEEAGVPAGVEDVLHFHGAELAIELVALDDEAAPWADAAVEQGFDLKAVAAGAWGPDEVAVLGRDNDGFLVGVVLGSKDLKSTVLNRPLCTDGA